MHSTTAPLASIGIDIGKEVFHIVGLETDGKIAFRRKIKRLALVESFKKMPPCVVGMEACLSAHFVSRVLRQLGHEPRIIPAIYVKPFVKGQKNDYNDAEAIAEASLRPNLRSVREKTQDQLDLQACHRVRSRLVSRRTATINQIRAFLIEQGIAVRTGATALRNSLPAILKNRQDEISPRMRGLIAGLYEDWICLDERIETIAGEIEKIGEKEANCRRLMSVPGIGPLISTAVVAAIGTGEASAGAILAHGLVSCHASTAQAADLSWAASPSEEVSISEPCSSRPQTSFSCARTIGSASALERGFRTQPRGCIATSWQRHWPTNWHGSPGASCATKRPSTPPVTR